MEMAAFEPDTSLGVRSSGGKFGSGIDFVGQGTAIGSTEGARAVAKSNTTRQALVDESGTVTGAKIIWNTNRIWNLPITDTAGDARMMHRYLEGTTTVTVAGLAATQ
jgi:hypothetical protein